MQKTFWALTCSVCALTATQAAWSQSSENDEIIVTGQKIERSLQDIAASVAVITANDIVDQNIISLSDAIDRTANIATINKISFSIRGINSLNVSGAGQSDLATIYIDGSPLTRDATLSGPLDVWDLSQIEIFRGPQSTLQGRNALAGAIIINTADPTYNWEGRLRAIAGTGDKERRLGVAFGGPIIDEQVAFRIASEVSRSDGYVDLVNLDSNDDESKSAIVRGKLLIEPAGIPDLSVNLSYTHDERKFGDDTFDLSVNDPANNRQLFSNRKTNDDAKLDVFTATIDYDITDGVSMTWITGYNESSRDRAADGDRTFQDTEFFIQTSDSATFTQELRFQVEKGRFEGVFGSYYADVETDFVTDTTFNLDVLTNFNLVPTIAAILQGPPRNFPALQANAIAQQVGTLYAGEFTINADLISPIEIESYAIFGDGQYQLTDDIKLYAGFRYDFEKQEIVTGNEITVLSQLPDPANPTFQAAGLSPIITLVNAQLTAAALNATQQRATANSPTFEAFLPKFGIGWDIDNARSLNFVVQKGYRSGGVGINTARAQAFIFDQEFIWNYEASLRSRWLDNKLTVNANAFYIDWTDQQTTVQLSSNTFDTETQNAGRSSVKGVEVESEYMLTDTIDVYGSVGYTKTEFEEFSAVVNNAVIDLSGNEFATAPRWTLAAGATWRDGQGWFANINGNYNSASFNRADRPQTERILDSRLLVNFRAGWEGERFGLFVTGDNIFDEAYATSLFMFSSAESILNPAFGRFGNPRTFAIQLEVKL